MTFVVPAIKYNQGSNTLYSFVMDGRNIRDIAAVSHLHQEDGQPVVGFQRPEIDQHIKSIREYLESSNGQAMIPNSLVVGFTKAPKFRASEQDPAIGQLTIGRGTALLVDGQQRSKAFWDADIATFPMSVVGFVAETESKLHEHFVRVNSAKPLNASLLRSLLPGIDAVLNAKLEKDRLPVQVVVRLNTDVDSPLKGRIKTAVNYDGFISENTVIGAVKESFGPQGYLYNLRDDTTIDRAVEVLKRYWGAVADVFPDAWDMSPRDSRLTHKSGFVSLSHLFDQIGDVSEPESLTKEKFTRILKKLKPVVHFTEGSWDLGSGDLRPWDKVENTVVGCNILKGLLARSYRQLLAKNDKGEKTGDAQ